MYTHNIHNFIVHAYIIVKARRLDKLSEDMNEGSV